MGTTLFLVALLLACDSLGAPTGPCGITDCDPPPPPVARADSFPVSIMDGAGLYGGGSNAPPAFHHDAGLAAATQVPTSGAVMVSLGMSITRAGFEAWSEIAATDAVMVNGACSGCTTGSWLEFTDRGWVHAFEKLTQASRTPADVDVVWMSVTGSVTAAARVSDLETILVRIREAYPNAQQVFVSNRTYGGYKVNVTAEPGAWEDGPVVREFVLNHLGETAPWVGWAGDVWANGEEPRSDGLQWFHSDFNDDGLHYSVEGKAKFGRLVRDQFVASPFTGWYLE